MYKKFLLSTNFSGLRQREYAITTTVSDRHILIDIGGSRSERHFQTNSERKWNNRKAVKEEMQFAIREAMKSVEPEAIAFWKAVAPDGKEPPIEKVIAMIALNVNNRMYN